MTVLTRLKLEGFFGIHSVEIPLDDQGLVLITGTNGSGKTALAIEGVYYGLFGRSFEYGKLPGDAVVNRFRRKLLVEVEFTRLGARWLIRRSRNHDEHGTKVSLFQEVEGEWVDRSRGTADETQSAITMQLGVTADVLTNSAIFSTDLIRFPDYSDRDKKRIISELAGLDSLDSAGRMVGEDLKAATQTVSEQERQLTHLQVGKDQAQASLDSFQAQLESFQGPLPEAPSQDDLRDAEDALRQAESNLATVEEAQKEHQRRLSERIDGLRLRVSELQKEQRAVRPNSPLPGLQEELAGFRATRTRLARAVAGVSKELEEPACPACNRPWGQEHKGPLQTRLQELHEKLDTLDSAIAEVLPEEEEARKACEESEANFSRLIGEAEEELRGLRHDPMTSQVSDARREVMAATDKLSSLRGALAAREGASVQRQRAVEGCHAAITKAQAQLSEWAEKIRAAEEALEAARKVVGDLTELQACFGKNGARVLLMQRALPVMNQAAAEASAILTRGTISVVFSSESGSLDIKVENFYGASGYHGNSAGERRKVDLITLFALVSLRSRPMNLMAVDEAFEKLSDESQEEVATFLKSLLRGSVNTVFMINHSARTIGRHADRVWQMVNGSLTPVDSPS